MGQLFRIHLVSVLYCEIAITIFQAGCGRNPFIQARARQLWLVCTSNDITMAVGVVNLFYRCVQAIGQQYKNCINMLIKGKGVNIMSVSPDAFVLSPSP